MKTTIELTPQERGSTREIRCIGWTHSIRISELVPCDQAPGKPRHADPSVEIFGYEDKIGYRVKQDAPRKICEKKCAN